MKIIIVSGFLGAGKTRFIQEMARQTGKQFVILENEFGKLGVDGTVLQQSNNMRVWELSEGCICCSLDLDFRYSVLTIANSLQPDYLLIEPSGVALPSKIMQQLREISYEQIGLLAPITVIDGQHFAHGAAQFPEYFDDQLMVAGTWVVSKSESFGVDDFVQLRQQLPQNGQANFPMQHYSKWSQEMWLSLLSHEVSFDEQGQMLFRRVAQKEKNQLENISIVPKFNSIDQLSALLLMLCGGAWGRVVRAKGYCMVGGYWLKFDLVDSSYAITGCETMPDERMVVIGQNLQYDEIRNLFSGSLKQILLN